jgi:hypothetical protein
MLAWFLAGALCACSLAGCVGEAEVQYKGSVTEAAGEARVTFDAEPNPDGLVPIGGARITLCVDCDSSPYGDTTFSKADGTWGPIDQVFGGFVGSTETIRLEVTADFMEPFVYQAVYEDTADPKNGELQMNIRMKRHGTSAGSIE